MTIGIFQGIGIGIAFLIHSFGSKDKYELKLKAANQAETNWAFLAMFIFGLTVWILNVYPEFYKVKVMKSGSIFWSNVFIYKLAAQDPAQSSAVILNTDGHYGQYNRAHRALYHFIENVTPVIITLPWTF